MADKIVQLKDKNSNNLYPISGASLAESVSTGAIVNGAITRAKLADEVIDTYQLADGAVTGEKIADETVDTINITDGAVTNDKIANGTIKANKIDFLTYMTAGLSSNVTIASPATSAPFNRITLNSNLSSRGDDFTLESGHIVCNFTGHVIIFATIYEVGHTTNGISNVYIYKNADNIIAARHNELADSAYIHIGPAIATSTCTPGDYYFMSGRFQSQTNISVGSGVEGTKLTIIRLA